MFINTDFLHGLSVISVTRDEAAAQEEAEAVRSPYFFYNHTKPLNTVWTMFPRIEDLY